MNLGPLPPAYYCTLRVEANDTLGMGGYTNESFVALTWRSGDDGFLYFRLLDGKKRFVNKDKVLWLDVDEIKSEVSE